MGAGVDWSPERLKEPNWPSGGLGGTTGRLSPRAGPVAEGPSRGRAPEPTSLVLGAVFLGQGEFSLDPIFQVLLFLGQHLLGLPKSGQGLLGAGGSAALRGASPFKELAQLAHGLCRRVGPAGESQQLPGPHLANR